MLCDVRWPEGARAVMGEARRRGVPTILDGDIAPPDELRALMGLADHLLLSQGALAALVPDTAPEEALRMVAAASGAEVAAVTLGADGALVLMRGTEAVRPVPSLPVRAVDTLNAGDVWHGTYAYGLARGWDPIARVRAANVAAAIKCETFGGKTGAPDLPTLLARLGSD